MKILGNKAVTSQFADSHGTPSTTKFSQLIFDVYLAIGFQLLYGRDTVVDSDGDGTPDTQDNFPFDKDRQ